MPFDDAGKFCVYLCGEILQEELKRVFMVGGWVGGWVGVWAGS